MKRKPNWIKRAGMQLLYIILCIILYPITWIGKLLFYIIKPLSALSYLMMGYHHTAKNTIADWRIMVDVGDAI